MTVYLVDADLLAELTQLLHHEALLLNTGRYEDWLERVAKIRTGLLQTENPPSRTVRLVSNVVVTGPPDATRGLPVTSSFLLYRPRRQRDVEILAGHRHDHWRRNADGAATAWHLARRQILFAANVLPTKSLSLFY